MKGEIRRCPGGGQQTKKKSLFSVPPPGHLYLFKMLCLATAAGTLACKFSVLPAHRRLRGELNYREKGKSLWLEHAIGEEQGGKRAERVLVSLKYLVKWKLALNNSQRHLLLERAQRILALYP